MTAAAVRIAALATAAAALLCGCGSSSSSTTSSSSADVAVTVNGTAVPLSLYTSIVEATRQRIEEVTGVTIDTKTAEGRTRLADLERTTLKDLVRDAAIDQLATQRHIAVSDADLDVALKRVASGLGGTSTLSEDIDQSRLDPGTFRTLYRYVVLSQRLRDADPAGFDTALNDAVSRAQVLAYAAPCDGANHTYPACAGG